MSLISDVDDLLSILTIDRYVNQLHVFRVVDCQEGIRLIVEIPWLEASLLEFEKDDIIDWPLTNWVISLLESFNESNRPVFVDDYCEVSLPWITKSFDICIFEFNLTEHFELSSTSFI